jgi:hypothetical protein
MASGQTLRTFYPRSASYPDADAASLDWILTASTDEPDHLVPVLDFDPGATQEYAYWEDSMPSEYDGGGITLTFVWSSDATSGNVIWSAAFKSLSDDADDLDTKAFAAENDSAADATASAAGEVAYTTITFTDGADMDSVAANEMFHLEVHRSSADASDTMNSNDAELHMIIMTET